MKKSTAPQNKILALILCISVISTAGLYAKTHMPNEYPGMIRLHVRANSNSGEDQELKLKVRNEILKHMEGQDSAEETRAYIREHLDEIERIAGKVIKDNGFDYPAKAEFKVCFIPEKTYEDMTLPAGNYETLNVKLGRGEGKNWWCVIYPRLCLLEKRAPGEKLILKSKIIELLKGRRRL